VFEKRFDLKRTDYILQLEITGSKAELSDACIELSLNGVNWVTAARLPHMAEKTAVNQVDAGSRYKSMMKRITDFD